MTGAAAKPYHHGNLAAAALAAVEGFRVLGEHLGAATPDMHAMGRASVQFAQQRPALFTVMIKPTVYRADDPGVVAARARTSAMLRAGVGQGPMTVRSTSRSAPGRSSTASPR